MKTWMKSLLSILLLPLVLGANAQSAEKRPYPFHLFKKYEVCLPLDSEERTACFDRFFEKNRKTVDQLRSVTFKFKTEVEYQNLAIRYRDEKYLFYAFAVGTGEGKKTFFSTSLFPGKYFLLGVPKASAEFEVLDREDQVFEFELPGQQ